eukprot:gnl/TRDRNA2_/TRDRNA2_88983_c0_seq1.p1 gnl/TRDRNA2_/TRDRNA2_88983_c0~~gnl/TRDRNA2_/TRDRNA2_88983_c0_seq1.p1  ORF type:complete len:385 (+),score=65.13 gnl/TRDRNA2_/TRDRNA2_88983_c0_seq1:42-1157(+)
MLVVVIGAVALWQLTPGTSFRAKIAGSTTSALWKSDGPSGWLSVSSDTGTLSGRASPRLLSAAEFLQSPRFTKEVGNQFFLKMRHGNFQSHMMTMMNATNGPSFPSHATSAGADFYSDKEVADAHKQAAKEVGDLIASLAKSHPKVATMLAEIRLDESQQDVACNLISHLTNENTMRIGLAAIKAFQTGMHGGGKQRVRQQLEAEFGHNLAGLRTLHDEIFPKGFETKLGRHNKDFADKHWHMIMSNDNMRSSIQSFDNTDSKHSVGTTAADARRLYDTIADNFNPKTHMCNVITIGVEAGISLITTVIVAVIPFGMWELIVMGVQDANALFACATLGGWAHVCTHWIGCVLTVLLAAVQAILMFVVPGTH